MNASRTVDYKEKMKEALESLKEIQQDINNLNNEVSKFDRQEQDILHIIENVRANAPEMCALYKRLQSVRQQRRDVKRRQEEARELRDFINAFKSATRNTMEKKIKSIEVLREEQMNKTYSLKELKELEPYAQRANQNHFNKQNKNKK